jgi:Mg-chelatase subunit ChlD
MAGMSIDRVSKLALEAARARFGKKAVARADVREVTDASDERAFNITFVVDASGGIDLSGEKMSQVSLDIIDFLVAKGDSRFPYTHYITMDELKQLQAAQ